MKEIKFKNDYFISEKSKKGTCITILKDDDKFYDVDMTGCKLKTNEEGFIVDEFTKEALAKIESLTSDKEKQFLLKIELRNRQLNRLINFLL